MGFCKILASLAVACLAAAPALAKGTDRDKFEKKVSRIARPSGPFAFGKARGLCACAEDGAGVIAGQVGMLFYSPASLMQESFLLVSCVIPLFAEDGSLASSEVCESWTPLAR